MERNAPGESSCQGCVPLTVLVGEDTMYVSGRDDPGRSYMGNSRLELTCNYPNWSHVDRLISFALL